MRTHTHAAWSRFPAHVSCGQNIAVLVGRGKLFGRCVVDARCSGETMEGIFILPHEVLQRVYKQPQSVGVIFKCCHGFSDCSLG